ncbi:MAG: ATP-binding protein [Magnetococcales bacterium]|nr:ATP-binding protein [Magnetococcales bacterium]MBF0114704.1 ATP-binding protein [Magnetococcales bacterium]
MRKKLANTSNMQRFMAGVGALEGRGAQEASMLLVVGDPGYGKTTIVNRWARLERAVYLCGRPGMTPHMVLGELVRELGEEPYHTSERRYRQAEQLVRLGQRPIILDEAQFYLSDKAECLEVVRSLTDKYEVVLVLVSMEQIQDKIAKLDQISSRVSVVVKMQPATLEDVKICCDVLCEVKIADCLTEEILFHTGGRYREIVNAIAAVERFGKRGGLEVVTRAAMVGEVLTHDWRDESPRRVREEKREVKRATPAQRTTSKEVVK